MKLVTMMAKACHYAQEYIDDSDAWSAAAEDREKYFTCVSYQMACFFAQNTKNGKNGVESNVVLFDLIETPMKNEQEWTQILNRIAKELGGWKNAK